MREVFTARGNVLIFDEVFLGFRLARGGAQEYFGVRADLVTYGKTLAGGWPIGVVCGRMDLMRRFREERPADICFARGTFNSHPHVMAAMQVFLERIETDEVRAIYRGLDECCNRRAVAGACGQFFLRVDRVLHGAVALQLDAPILPADGGPRAELDWHRPVDFQIGDDFEHPPEPGHHVLDKNEVAHAEE